MHAKLIGLTFLVVLLIAPVLAAEDEPNLCYTTHAGLCQTDSDWQTGWFWANHPPSQSSCDLYQGLYGNDDWGMCSQFGGSSDDGQPSAAESQQLFELTSQWHAMPDDGSSPCPYEGLDPIMNYEDNTFVCATSF